MQRLELRGIHKNFGGLRALHGVSFAVQPGEVHALVVENGAGKSTLIKILAGVYQPDAGQIALDGQPVTFPHPRDASAHGIGVVHQELAQYPDLSVLENLFINAQDLRGPLRSIDWKALRRRALNAFGRLGVQLDLDRPVAELSTAQGQLIEIARALTRNVRYLIMDEPTASLTERDTQLLYQVVDRLRADGVGVIYISHRLEEIFVIADRVTVLRDGESVGTSPVAGIRRDRLVTLMVGRELSGLYPELPAATGHPLLEISGLARRGAFSDISFSVHSGEILGLAGLVGAGRTEVARCIFGIDRADAGSVLLDGRRVPASPWGAIATGIGYVSEDRKGEGLVLPMSIAENVGLPILRLLQSRGLLDVRRERRLAAGLRAELRIRAPDVNTAAEDLSGGNQQKVSLAKWLATKPRLLILDEPTRGVDVGAKAQVHQLMAELCAQGIGILMISSDLPEVLGMSHRIIVMADGRLQGELQREAFSQEAVMSLAAGSSGVAA
jgi:ABC-type sugar transport system ATPase subunit